MSGMNRRSWLRATCVLSVLLVQGCAPVNTMTFRSSATRQFDSTKVQKILISTQDLTHRYIPEEVKEGETTGVDLSAVRELEHEFVFALSRKGYEPLVSSDKSLMMARRDANQLMKDTGADALMLVSVAGPKWGKKIFNMMDDYVGFDTIEVRVYGPEGGLLWTASDSPEGAPQSKEEVFKRLKNSASVVANLFPEKGEGQPGK